MQEGKARARVFRKGDALRLRYEDPPRTLYIWIDRSSESKHVDFLTLDLAPGERAPAHAHSVAEESMWIHRGRGVIFIEGEEFPVEEGVLIFAPPGVRHQMVNTGDETMTVACFYAPPGTEAQFRLRKPGAAAAELPTELPPPGTPAPSPA